MQQQEILETLSKLILNTNESSRHTINDCFQAFIDNTTLYARKATKDYYIKNYKSLNKYLIQENIFFLEDLSILKMNKLVARIKSTNIYKNNTINKFIELIKMISKFSYYSDIVEYDKIAKFKKLPNDNVETKTINLENIHKILEFIKPFEESNNKCDLRNSLFIHLLKDTGARYNEIINISKNNLRLEKNQILLTFTKTKKERNVNIMDDTKQLIIKYLQIANIKDYLFINFKTNKIVIKSQMYAFMDRIKNKLKLKQSISPHKWRHTLATELLRHNLNIEQVRKILGHTSLNTTQKYLHLNSEEDNQQILSVMNDINF